MIWLVLHDDPHDSSDELDVGSQAAERSEDGGDAEAGGIEALAQHLDLNDAVELSKSEALEDGFLIGGIHVAVDLGGSIPALLVDRPDLAGVIDRARRRDDLMREPRLSPHRLAAMDARFGDVPVALG